MRIQLGSHNASTPELLYASHACQTHHAFVGPPKEPERFGNPIVPEFLAPVIEKERSKRSSIDKLGEGQQQTEGPDTITHPDTSPLLLVWTYFPIMSRSLFSQRH